MRQPCLGIWAQRAILFIGLHWDWVSHPSALSAFSVSPTLGPRPGAAESWGEGAMEAVGGPEQEWKARPSRTASWVDSVPDVPLNIPKLTHRRGTCNLIHIYHIQYHQQPLTQSHSRRSVTAQGAYTQPHPARPHISHTVHTQPRLAIHKSCRLHSQMHSCESSHT